MLVNSRICRPCGLAPPAPVVPTLEHTLSVTDGPTTPAGTTIDKEAIRQKYLEERDKRLRPDGNDQYVRLTGQLAHYLADPYTPVAERDPKTDHVLISVFGAQARVATRHQATNPGGSCPIIAKRARRNPTT